MGNKYLRKNLSWSSIKKYSQVNILQIGIEFDSLFIYLFIFNNHNTLN